VHKKEIIREIIRVWNLDRDLGIFRRILQCYKIYGHFLHHNLARISGEDDWIFVKILPQTHLWTTKSPLNFGSHSDAIHLLAIHLPVVVGFDADSTRMTSYLQLAM